MSTPRFRPNEYLVRPKDFGITMGARWAPRLLSGTKIAPDDPRLWAAVIHHRYMCAVTDAVVDTPTPAGITTPAAVYAHTVSGLTRDRAYRLLTGAIVLRVEDIADLHRVLRPGGPLVGAAPTASQLQADIKRARQQVVPPKRNPRRRK